MGRAMKEILTAIRQRGDLEKPMVSVGSLLKQVDRENYLDMCCSRLADSELLDGEDAAVYIRAELWHRSIFAEIVRKIRYGCTNLYVKIKYHRIFSAAKKAVVEGIL